MITQDETHSLTPPIGVIESLASGLETTIKQPLLLLFPAVLDLFLWLGPRLSFRPLLTTVSQSVINGLDPVALPSLILVLSLCFPLWSHPEVREPVTASLNEAMSQENYTNVGKVVEDIARNAPEQYLDVYMPSVVGGRDAGTLPFGYLPPVWQIQSTGEIVGLRLLLLLGGLVAWTIYLAIVAQWVKEERGSLGWMLRHIPAVFLQIMLVLVMLGVAFFMLALIFFVIQTIATLVGAPGLVVIPFLLAIIVGSWVLLFSIFTLHGMYLNDRGIFSAAWDSLRVVQWNTSSTLGLFLAILLVLTARHYVANQLDPGSWLILVGIAANAFLCTGLLAATFVFFKDRYRYWRELRDKLLAELASRRVQQ